jgi:ATP-dependent DNA ligase
VGTTSRPPKWIKPQLTRLVDEVPAGAGWVHEIKYDGYRMHARIDGREIKLLTRTGLDWSHRYRTTIEALRWIKPQLTRLVDEAPAGDGWVHEIKYDGYRMHARIDGGDIKLLTRTGLDWSHRYRRTIEALGALKVKSAYLDGELCALDGFGVPMFSRLQAAMDEGSTDRLVFFAFDLLYLNGDSTAQLPLLERKKRLQPLFKKEIHGLRYSEHVVSDGPAFASTPASSDWKASSQSASIGHMRPATEGSG